ncbi:hypothetical protein L486_01108 [Kwoniella mangroviensis CBS 10435]|uniref:BRCT domain-containing protein n=1 Tax=Kwoniella mangroviensis CBS 10435 TaxID=1331196 RepID=A0A1B9J0Z6_9TREE|nr:uncharacterized protein I203_05964 [Kwoniella mangroviensis CBS 8507]OCF61460.1 hypothetical protein L486_01108 [Kwoniella mangroviensis CBS 10435]OCF64720.1 hypothetical protein I203_05964 [Kwoniella mangroviensis CBS 8507]OCF77480.1 hypothetical protein I204_01468 [Kwoniella mangroviensis CBS 8886]
MRSSTFSGQSFWVVGHEEEMKSQVEQKIRDNGGLICPILQMATRIIIIEPDIKSFRKSHIPEAFKAIEEAEGMNTFTATVFHWQKIGWKDQ